MDTLEVKGKVVDLDVLRTTGAQIKDMDEQEFCQLAVRLDRVVDAANEVGVSIAEYVHALVVKLIDRNGGYGEGGYDKEIIEREFLGTVARWESYLKSPLAGAYQVDELPKSIDQAKRKIHTGIERKADFRIENSCSKVAQANTKWNKAEKKRKEDEAVAAFQQAHGLYDPDKSGPQGVPGADASEVEITMAKLAKKLDEIAGVDKARVKAKLIALETWADDVLAELKGSIGARVVNQ